MFLKAASDELLLYYPYNLKIKLEEGKTSDLKFSLLYQYTSKKLQTMKQYLIENLSKGFIKQSQYLFATLILFTQKANGGLHLYVNYCKLNTVTKKD